MVSSVVESWQYFRYLFLEGLGIVVIPPFGVAAVLLIVGMVASFFAQNPAKSGRWKLHYWLILSQLLFYPAVIAIGVIYAASPRRPIDPLPRINPVAEGALDAITCVSLALGVFWVWRLKGVRWIAFFFVALQLLFLYGALFLAGMSVSGDWI